jgi:hypothetical protein
VGLSHARFDILHYEDMGVRGYLGVVSQQGDLLLGLPHLGLINNIVQGSSVDCVVREPVKLWADRSLAGVEVLPLSIDEDSRRILLLDEVLEVQVVVNRVNFEVLLVFIEFKDFHPEFASVRLLFSEYVNRGIADTNQSMTARLVHSGAPPEVVILNKVILLVLKIRMGIILFNEEYHRRRS